MLRRNAVAGTLLALLLGGARLPAQEASALLEWPQLTSVNRPWTRWWWQGSAVTDAGLTAALESYRAAGLGGVEVTPIYGVAGFERQFIEYLSPTWISRLEHTLREAERLGLGVDLATGTGWPFGGRWVSDVDAAKYLALDTIRVNAGERLQAPLGHVQKPVLRAIGNRAQLPGDAAAHPLQRAGRERITLAQLTDPITGTPDLQALAPEQVRFPKPLPLVAVVARSTAGEQLILTERVGRDNRLDWTAPPGDWTLFAAYQGWHGKLVERAAPGGEGMVLDHFSAPSLLAYLAHFDSAFGGRERRGLRAFFNDSYEVDDAQGEADWTPSLLAEFRARRGYDLVPHLPELLGRGDTTMSARVLSDYRETMSDLLLDNFTRPWNAWANGHRALTRNQAHGSPASILDLYAASGIPETEGTDILRFKTATSAANVTGKPLVSAEAATWLNEHFLSSLADVKKAVDRYFIAGVNHIVYHGTAYSPEDVPWPGWLFYAAVHFQPTSPLWRDFRALNDYVARSQSILQNGRPENDVLLYLPVHDRWAVRDRTLLVHFDGSMSAFAGMAVADDAALLQRRGFAFDLVSDRQLLAATAAGGTVRTAGGSEYRVVVVPDAHLLPTETLARLLTLAEQGGTVIFHRALPADVPGLRDLDARRLELRRMLARIDLEPAGASGVRGAAVGAGRVLLGDSLEALLAAAGVRRESLVDSGLQFVRRRHELGVDYFITNWTDATVDGWVPLASRFPAAALFEPMTGETGIAKLRNSPSGGTEVYLQLAPGGSIIVRGRAAGSSGRDFGYYRPAGAPRPLAGAWRLRFLEGGPSLPAPLELRAPASWTELGGDATRAFSGTASYTLTFSRPTGEAPYWRLDLGEVRESARVRLNGTDLGTLIGPTYAVTFPGSLFRDRNLLEVTVSNLMANRIAAMDRQQVPWKRFYNVNFPANQRANAGADGLFDASRWEPRPSGLIGPVTLAALDPY